MSADSEIYTDSGLTPSTTYTYRVRAKDAGGESEWTNYESATTNYQRGVTAGSLIFSLNYVPGGTFPTGTADSGEATVSAYWIGETEATNELVAAVYQWAYNQGKMSTGTVDGFTVTLYGQELLDLNSTSIQISFSGGAFSVDSGFGDYPCVEITWYGSIMFCNWLTEMVNGSTDELVYSGMDSDWVDDETIENVSKTGFRLPSRFEHE